MANIYNDSNSVNQSQNQNNIVVENLTAENAFIDNLNVDGNAVFDSLRINNITQRSILIAGPSGDIDGLLPGNNNEVFVSDGIDALWTNSLVLQDLQTNTLKIPLTQQGDLLITTNTQMVDRLAVGSSGQFLISDGVNPQWEDLPNPLILGSLQVNENLQLTNYPNCNAFTDSTGFLINERSKFTQGGTQGFTTTPSQFYGSATWYMVNTAWYKLKVVLTSSNSNSFYGDVKINALPIAYFHYIGPQTNTITIDQIYQHNGTTGLQGIALTAQTSSGISSISYYQIYLERISDPVIV